MSVDDKVARRLTKLEVRAEELRGQPVPKGMTLIRLLDPEQVADPEGIVEHGIVRAKDDAENVLGYLWTPDLANAKKTEFVPANEMIHLKINVDSDVARGRSLLEPLLKRDREFDLWLAARIQLSIARARVVWVKKVEGTPAQGAALRAELESQREDASNDRRVRAPREATTIMHGPGISYEFKTPNLQASDAQEDGRAIQLNMAAAAGMPEFMFTGDASNANFSSTLVAEGPAYREFESWQDDLSPVYEQIFRWVLEDAAEFEVIPGLTKELAAELELAVRWPSIEVRDEEKHTNANQVRYNAGILSREGWAEDEGIDYRVERGRVAREREEDLEFMPPGLEPRGAGGGADDEKKED